MRWISRYWLLVASVVLMGIGAFGAGLVVSLAEQQEVQVRALAQELESCQGELREAGEHLFEAGDAILECDARCKREAAAYIERGNILFECEETICEANGWTPPADRWRPEDGPL